jgi:hypothetical protein
MVNFRAMRNYISLGCVRKYHIKIYDKETLYKLALADGSLIR